jgi:hypothetical protein
MTSKVPISTRQPPCDRTPFCITPVTSCSVLVATVDDVEGPQISTAWSSKHATAQGCCRRSWRSGLFCQQRAWLLLVVLPPSLKEGTAQRLSGMQLLHMPLNPRPITKTQLTNGVAAAGKVVQKMTAAGVDGTRAGVAAGDVDMQSTTRFEMPLLMPVQTPRNWHCPAAGVHATD